MPRALRVCSRPGCPELTDTGGRCAGCKTEAERQRGSAAQRGYGRRHATRFRAAVLRRDPICRCTDQGHGHGAQCYAASRHADHHPLSRRELVARGMDADDPKHGRGLCHPCHSRSTAVSQPGGWNAR